MDQPAARELTDEEARELLASGAFLPSQGLGWGEHWRSRAGAHLRRDLEGRWTIHADTCDPRGGFLPLLRHLWYDVFMGAYCARS